MFALIAWNYAVLPPGNPVKKTDNMSSREMQALFAQKIAGARCATRGQGASNGDWGAWKKNAFARWDSD